MEVRSVVSRRTLLSLASSSSLVLWPCPPPPRHSNFSFFTNPIAQRITAARMSNTSNNNRKGEIGEGGILSTKFKIIDSHLHVWASPHQVSFLILFHLNYYIL